MNETKYPRPKPHASLDARYKAWEKAKMMVEEHVHANASHLVDALTVYGDPTGLDADDITYQVYDYESAALEAGWKYAPEDPDGYLHLDGERVEDFQTACEFSGLEPEEKEIKERWIVTDWLAHHLLNVGESVDIIFGLYIWNRTTSDHHCALDDCMERISAWNQTHYPHIL